MANNLTEITEKVANVLMNGDISKFSQQEKIDYHNKLCEHLGLNPLTQPFQYMTLDGKLKLYAKKSATDQLRVIKGISIYKMEETIVSGIFIVTVYARDKNGNEDIEKGAVPIQGLGGDKLANAMMKAATKAKRRVTLSLAGLGMLDETEVETIKERD